MRAKKALDPNAIFFLDDNNLNFNETFFYYVCLKFEKSVYVETPPDSLTCTIEKCFVLPARFLISLYLIYKAFFFFCSYTFTSSCLILYVLKGKMRGRRPVIN